MQQLIDVIRAAITTDANSEQKVAGVQACRTIATALDTEPGKPLTLPGTTTQAGPRVSIDQVLDLVIARLNMIASEREGPARPEPTDPAVASVAPRGLRIPITPTNALTVASGSRNSRPATKVVPRPGQVPHAVPAPRRSTTPR